MKKRTGILLEALCLCAVIAGVSVYAAVRARNAGKTADNVLAKYRDCEVTAEAVEHHKRVKALIDGESGRGTVTDLEIINDILKNEMLYDEALSRGYSATEAEAEALVQNARSAYALPEGKAFVDDYCRMMDITVDAYFEQYRQQLHRQIVRQKLKNEIIRQYCQENDLEYQEGIATEEMLAAVDAYIEELFRQHQKEIRYYL